MRRLALLFVLAIPLGVAPAWAQTPNCHKGKPCGHTCIAKWKTCHVGTPSGTEATSLPAPTVPANAQYVASSRGHVYYWKGCSAWRRLSRSNLIFFKSASEAQAAGYTPSKSHGCARPSGNAVSAGSAAGAALSPTCGVERWPVKVLSDPDASKVRLAPKNATIEQLRSLTRPSEIGYSRRAPSERQVYRVEADLIGWVSEEDSDLHMVLAAPGDRSETIIAEIPAADCAKTTSPELVEAFRSARATVVKRLGPAPSGYAELIHPLQVTVTGVGFFDFAHNQHGLAPNAIELHPVLNIEFQR